MVTHCIYSNATQKIDCVCVLCSLIIMIIMIHLLFPFYRVGRQQENPVKVFCPPPHLLRQWHRHFQQAFQRQVAYAPTSNNAKDLTAAISCFISKDMMPFQVVEMPGFLRMMKVAVPHYKVPSRTFFSKTDFFLICNLHKVQLPLTARWCHV